MFLGTLSLVVGIIGAFLPILPTTPFVLLALFFYVRSSPKLHARVIKSRWAGKHVHNVMEGRGIPLSVKLFALSISFCMIGYVAIVHTENFFVRMGLGLLFAVQLYFMIRIKTLKPDPQQPLVLETSNEQR